MISLAFENYISLQTSYFNVILINVQSLLLPISIFTCQCLRNLIISLNLLKTGHFLRKKKMFRAIRMMGCELCGCIVSWSTIYIKAFEREREKLSFRKIFTSYSYFENFLNGHGTLWPETCLHNFLPAAYFSVHPIEKCCQLFLLQEKIGICFLLNGSNL